MMNLYDMFSGGKPNTGGEFKLMYGNREKMDKASGLSVWVFEDISTKLENFVFTATLENTNQGYIQYQEPNAGNEFKFLYGNRQKVALASEKSEFIFGEISDRDTISGVSIVEDMAGNCFMANGLGCYAVGEYSIEDIEHRPNMKYEWSLGAGEATITSGTDLSTVTVQTVDSLVPKNFELRCLVIDNMVAQRYIADNFTHTKSDITIVIGTLTEALSGSCNFETNFPCVATSIYSVSATNVETYKWIVTGNAVVTAGQGTNAVTVSTQSQDTADNFNVECICSNSVDSKTISGDFTHTRVETVVTPVAIEYFNEVVGSCIYDYQGTCTTESVYEVITSGTPVLSYHWTVDSDEGAYLLDGQGTSIIRVESTDMNTDSNFSVSCVIDNSQYESSYTQSYIHTRTEKIYPQIVINGISLTQGGSCAYAPGGGTSCTASGTYALNSTGHNHTEWTVVGGTIIAGQNTNIVTIETPDGTSDQTFSLTCVASNDKNEGSFTKDFTHTKNEGILPPVTIESLMELTSGSCGYDDGQTCVANSTYKINATNADVYTWTVTGSVTWEPVSGKTDEIIVTSTSGSDETFTVKCVASHSQGSEEIESIFTHVRTINVYDISDGVHRYDETNIAQEFV